MIRRFVVTHPRFFVAAIALLPLTVGIATWHYWTLYTSLSGARDDLVSAQARLSDVGFDLSSSDIVVARERIDAADGKLSRARAHMRWDPLVQTARRLPGLGPQVSAASDFLDMAGLLVDIGRDATTAGQKAVALRDRPAEGRPLTASLIDLLADTRPEVERINENTRKLVRRREEMGDSPLIGPLARARDHLDVELPQLANAIEQVAQSQSLLPGFLGFSGGRHYLVLALNNGELMPGGGFVTAAGILPVQDGVNGRVEFTDSTLWKPAWERAGGRYIPPPGPLQRYLLKDYTWSIAVSNWTPDYPTWSQQALEFYRLVHGEQPVDGVVAVDLVVLERLLAITGPKTLEVAGYGRVTFDSANAILELERLTRAPTEANEDRKSVIGDLVGEVIGDLLKLPAAKWGMAIEVVRKLGEERHVQVLSFRPEEQTIVRDMRWDGRLEDTTGDYTMFNEASLNSTKLNLIIQPVAKYRVDISALGDARHELSLHYRNPLPEWSVGKDPELIDALMLGGVYGGYLRVFSPKGAARLEVEINGVPAAIEDQGVDGDRSWFGVFLSLPAGREADVTLRWTVSLATHAPSAKNYDLYLQKQPGTPGLCTTLEVTREGQRPTRLTVRGGRRDAEGRTCTTSDVRVYAEF